MLLSIRRFLLVDSPTFNLLALNFFCVPRFLGMKCLKMDKKISEGIETRIFFLLNQDTKEYISHNRELLEIQGTNNCERKYITQRRREYNQTIKK